MMMTAKKRVTALAVLVVMLVAALLTGCQSDGQSVTGTWYGVDDSGAYSTLEINKDSTWLFTGDVSGSGEWNETDSGTIVLSATLISVPFKLEGSGDDRTLVFAGEDPHGGNAPELSSSTFYATEEARDTAAK